jgi:hypothetical protein
MEADMLLATNAANASESSRETGTTLVDRIHDAIAQLAPAVAGGPDVWARGAGLHVLLGIQGEEAFARLTPLGGGLFGLAFRAMDEGEGTGTRHANQAHTWDPLLLIDELAAVVEHALVAVEAIVIQ